ncbi:MAG TPA: VTT domain-containing protein [Bacillaceae bacterium]
MSEIEGYLEKEIHIALFITFLLMVFQNLFTLVPLFLIITINIFLFGFLYGYLWSWGTSVAGGMAAFFLYRYWFQSFLANKISPGIKEKIEYNGLLYVLYARLIPFAPSSLINMASGVSSIKFSHYTLATMAGNLIYVFILCLIVNGLMSPNMQHYVIIALLLALLPGWYLYQRMKKRRVQTQEGREL